MNTVIVRVKLFPKEGGGKKKTKQKTKRREMRIFTWVQLLWERKAPAGASSDRNIPIHRTPTHTSFNFMRHYCRDTKLGRLPLGFSWLQQREAWTRFRAGARTFLDGKVTYPPPLPCPVPISTPPPTAAFWCLPAQMLPLFPWESSPETRRWTQGPPSARDG